MRLLSRVLLFVFAASTPGLAQSVTKGKLELEGAVAFTEGPAWHRSGNVYFTDIANNRIMRRDPKGAMHVFRTPSGRANGLLFDQQGRLLACEGGGEGGNRRLTRTEADGTITRVLTKGSAGTPSYRAPEVTSTAGYFAPAVDVWSLGILSFSLVAGFFPLQLASSKDWRFVRLAQEQAKSISSCDSIFGMYNRPCPFSPHRKHTSAPRFVFM